jgi:hypothetical protein
MKDDPLYKQLASLVDARLRCEGKAFDVRLRGWYEKHTESIRALVQEYMPHGSGFDNGTKIDLDRSTSERLVFTTAFHHMNEHGGYDGWTEHTVTVTASLAFNFSLKIGGRNRNDIKDYMHEVFACSLNIVRPIAKKQTA